MTHPADVAFRGRIPDDIIKYIADYSKQFFKLTTTWSYIHPLTSEDIRIKLKNKMLAFRDIIMSNPGADIVRDYLELLCRYRQLEMLLLYNDLCIQTNHHMHDDISVYMNHHFGIAGTISDILRASPP